MLVSIKLLKENRPIARRFKLKFRSCREIVLIMNMIVIMTYILLMWTNSAAYNITQILYAEL